MFSLLDDLCFVLCSLYVRAQRIMVFIITHKSTRPENPITWKKEPNKGRLCQTLINTQDKQTEH